MKTVFFPALELEIPLGRFQVYQDMGFVEKPRSYLRKNAPMIGHPIFRILPGIFHTPLFEKGEPLGACVYQPLIPRNLVRVAIAYLDTGNEIDNLGIRAHEETHALIHLGKKGILEHILQEEHDVKIDLSKHPEEHAADIGAVYALKKRGLFWEQLVGIKLYSALVTYLNHKDKTKGEKSIKIEMDNVMAILGG